ncbi:hypothetical protein C8R47DRAFT_1273759 [Mycena vitilis]|nr:hypothetical protein C8R47DRAFT_1273759 [Mycena vitilis]
MAQVADASVVPAPAKQSDKYWLEDGSVHFQVEDVVYKVHVSHFKILSPNVASILNIPDNMAGPKQGSEANPILLEGFTCEVFEDFLAWIYRAEWTPFGSTDLVVKERRLVNLLRVGRLWEIHEAVQYAKFHLDAMYLPSSRRLQLARMFSLYDIEWIDQPVRALVTGKLDWITPEDIDCLGTKTYSIILEPHPAWVSDAHDHRACTEVFNEVWWTKIARKMIDPAKPLHFSKIAAKVRETAFQVQRVGGWKVMEDICKEDVAAKIEQKGFFSEDAVVDAAISSTGTPYASSAAAANLVGFGLPSNLTPSASRSTRYFGGSASASTSMAAGPSSSLSSAPPSVSRPFKRPAVDYAAETAAMESFNEFGNYREPTLEQPFDMALFQSSGLKSPERPAYNPWKRPRKSM